MNKTRYDDDGVDDDDDCDDNDADMMAFVDIQFDRIITYSTY